MQDTLQLKVNGIFVRGTLHVPDNASGLIIFSHGSGSSRFSPRNNFVANFLNTRGLATFLFDLLTAEEDDDYTNRFNIDLLSRRLVQVTRALMKLSALTNLPLGYFGASTGAASALVAAAMLPSAIRAVVSRGGRPDLAMNHLTLVKAPTLLLVGEHDRQVIHLNQRALAALPAIKELEIVKGATHLFEEAGALEEVARLSAAWFEKYLVSQIVTSHR